MILAPWTVEPWSISIDSEGPKKERKIISVCTMQPCLCAMTCYVFTINEYSQVAQLRQRESRTQTKCCEMQWSGKNSHNASQLIRPKAFEKFKFTIQMGLLIPNNLSMTTFGVIKWVVPPACYALEIRVVLPAVGCRESGPCELVTCNNPICNRLQPLSPGKTPSHHRQSNWDGTNGGFAKTKRRSPRLGHWRRLASRSFAVLGPNVCHQHPRSLQSTPICLVHPCRDRGDHPCPQHSDTTQHRHHSPIHR